MGTIRLLGIECRVHLGVPEAERRRRQQVLIDLSMELDLAAAAERDDLRLSVDYWGLEKAVREIAQGRERRLAEALARDVARAALAFDRRAQAVTVAVHKKPAVMPRTREVVVELSEKRR